MSITNFTKEEIIEKCCEKNKVKKFPFCRTGINNLYIDYIPVETYAISF